MIPHKHTQQVTESLDFLCLKQRQAIIILSRVLSSASRPKGEKALLITAAGNSGTSRVRHRTKRVPPHHTIGLDFGTGTRSGWPRVLRIRDEALKCSEVIFNIDDVLC